MPKPADTAANPSRFQNYLLSEGKVLVTEIDLRHLLDKLEVR